MLFWRRHLALATWAARDLLRRPGETLLLWLAVVGLALLLSTPLLLLQGLGDTAEQVLADAPALVIRRLDASGFAPIPAEDAAARLRQVPGVIAAEPRLFGVVSGPNGPVSLRGLTPELRERFERAGLGPLPEPGEVLVGAGLGVREVGLSLELRGAQSLSLRVVGVLPAAAAIVGHDLALIGESEARWLLAVGPGQATDLAVQVFHEAEAEAIRPELLAALPWPARASTRAEAVGAYATSLGRRGSLSTLLAAPALLGLVVLLLVGARARRAQRAEAGLLKSLGWSSAELLALSLWRDLLVALPGLALGLLLGHALVFWPGNTWVSGLLLGWGAQALPLRLSPAGAVAVLAQVGGVLLGPWLVASIWGGLRAALADPGALLERGGGR